MAVPCRLGNLVYVAVWLSGSLAILLEPAYSKPVHQQPVTADSRPCPATGSHAAPHQDLGGEGEGAHAARSCSQDISGPFTGTGPGGAHATLSSVVVSLMLAYPHSSALHPCSSRFLFDCDLLPSHGGPQLSTLLALCVCLSALFFSRDGLVVASCQAAHRIACSAATVYTCRHVHCCTPIGISTSVRVLWPSGGRRLSASFAIGTWPNTHLLLPLGWQREYWYQILDTDRNNLQREPRAVAALLRPRSFSRVWPGGLRSLARFYLAELLTRQPGIVVRCLFV